MLRARFVWTMITTTALVALVTGCPSSSSDTAKDDPTGECGGCAIPFCGGSTKCTCGCFEGDRLQRSEGVYRCTKQSCYERDDGGLGAEEDAAMPDASGTVPGDAAGDPG